MCVGAGVLDVRNLSLIYSLGKSTFNFQFNFVQWCEKSEKQQFLQAVDELFRYRNKTLYSLWTMSTFE